MMSQPENILIVHPMAIGDVVLGTPVAAALKRQYPNARITYFTHASLEPLLRLCGAIDECLEWTRKAPVMTQVAMVQRRRPDLIVDLTSSFRTRLICMLSGVPSSGYKKQPKMERPVVHVTDRYLAVLDSIGVPKYSSEQAVFPTLDPTADLLNAVRTHLQAAGLSTAKPLIAIVPGVGGLRPNRAWAPQSWVQLARELSERHSGQLILIGGPDDVSLCNEVERGLGADQNAQCYNAAGKLTLPETAALFKLCALAVSGDTGPCHIAVGVGLPVVSIMRPTLPSRSGPYGCLDLAFDCSPQCECVTSKTCRRQSGVTYGACLSLVNPEDVADRVLSVLSGSGRFAKAPSA